MLCTELSEIVWFNIVIYVASLYNGSNPIYLRVMKLSIWHSQALYVMTNLDLVQVAKTAEVSLDVLSGKAKQENWQFKKDKFKTLSETSKNDLDVLEFLLGEFQSNANHVEYVRSLLHKLKLKESQQTKESAKEQFVNQLGEFGMDAENARRLIEQMARDLSMNPSETDVVADVVASTQLSVQERIDTVAAGYAMLVQNQSANASDMHNKLNKHIGFFSKMMDQLEARLPNSMDFEDLAALQRSLSYVASSYAKLATLQYDLSGLKSYVNHNVDIAKLFGKGYTVMKRDELGKLVEGN